MGKAPFYLARRCANTRSYSPRRQATQVQPPRFLSSVALAQLLQEFAHLDTAAGFPAIVEAAQRLKAQSFLIDGECVIARNDGTSDFYALRSRHRGHEAMAYAFDLIEHDGDDLRNLPLIERKRRLARLLGRVRGAIRYSEHLTEDGAVVFEHVCSMGLEGIVSKRTNACDPFRSSQIIFAT